VRLDCERVAVLEANDALDAAAEHWVEGGRGRRPPRLAIRQEPREEHGAARRRQPPASVQRAQAPPPDLVHQLTQLEHQLVANDTQTAHSGSPGSLPHCPSQLRLHYDTAAARLSCLLRQRAESACARRASEVVPCSGNTA